MIITFYQLNREVKRSAYRIKMIYFLVIL
jgi:hypothetical protein